MRTRSAIIRGLLMKPTHLLLLAFVISVSAKLLLRAHIQHSNRILPYKDTRLGVEQRLSDLLQRMTLEEKVAMLDGSGWMETEPNARLGIPSIKMADGPMGIRSWLGSSDSTNAAATSINSTAFPAGIAMAATWDPALLRREGRAIGQETRALDRDMILGPTVNIN